MVGLGSKSERHAAVLVQFVQPWDKELSWKAAGQLIEEVVCGVLLFHVLMLV